MNEFENKVYINQSEDRVDMNDYNKTAVSFLAYLEALRDQDRVSKTQIEKLIEKLKRMVSEIESFDDLQKEEYKCLEYLDKKYKKYNKIYNNRKSFTF